MGELRSDSESNRIQAAKGLVKIGPSASEAVMGFVGRSYEDKTASAALETQPC